MTDTRMVEQRIVSHVGLVRRTTNPDYTFAQGLKDHRRQLLGNLRDDGDETWLQLIGVVDRIATEKRIDMTGEPTLENVLNERRTGQGALP